MARKIISILALCVISLVVGAGVAYVAIPTFDQNYNNNQASTTTTQTITQQVTQTVVQQMNQTGIIQEKYKSWENETYLLDWDTTWVEMFATQMNMTIQANSQIKAQFSVPFDLLIASTLSGNVTFLVSLAIQAPNGAIVGNITTPIYYSRSSTASANININLFPTLTVMTDSLPIGTYKCFVNWRSVVAHGASNSLTASWSNYRYARWMILDEIAG